MPIRGASALRPRSAAGTPGAHPSTIWLAVALVLLAVAAVGSCVAEVAYLFLRVPVGDASTLPLPVMVLFAGVINCVLVAEARKWSPRWTVRLFPLAAWTLTLVCLHLGPGGNMPVPPSLRGLALVAAGLGVPVVWMQLRTLREMTTTPRPRP